MPAVGLGRLAAALGGGLPVAQETASCRRAAWGAAAITQYEVPKCAQIGAQMCAQFQTCMTNMFCEILLPIVLPNPMPLEY